ncbi:BQ2448_545 [Microbotryum intermedium]|uniref:BQ2448_545 protein n=1 Tax=Microbotryum intermedium TaxID=269621 RepID=A0A238F973_9BASI|nr:BQ2448_545 [Microbotryum intermedium]
MSDPGSDPRLLRLSIGLEDFHDLKRDLIEGFTKVLAIEKDLMSSKL